MRLIRSASAGGNTVSLKYDPLGNRIFRQVDDGQSTTKRKYIIDVVGDLPKAAKNWSTDMWKTFLARDNNKSRMLQTLWDTTSQFDKEYGTKMLPKLMDTLMDQL